MRVWYIGRLSDVDGEEGSRAIRNLRRSHRKGATGHVQHILRQDKRPPPVNSTIVTSENASTCFRIYELAQSDDNEYGVLRFYSLNASVVAAVLEGGHVSTCRSNTLPFPFRISPTELDIIHNGGCKADDCCSPLLIVGRSGSGKTTSTSTHLYE